MGIGVQRIDSPPRGVPWATFILNDKVVYQTKQQTGQWLIVKHHAVLNK